MSNPVRERALELLDYCPETGVFQWRTSPAQRVKAGDVAGSVNQHGYLRIGFDGERYLAHRLAFLIIHGRWPSPECDHINRDRQDNRACNLREVTRHQNMLNKSMYANNLSGHPGVYWHSKNRKWAVSRRRNGKSYFLGLFDNLEDAASVAANFTQP